jgi:hypothetical protein
MRKLAALVVAVLCAITVVSYVCLVRDYTENSKQSNTSAQHSNPANNPSAQHSNPANNPSAQHSNPANSPSAKHSNPANSPSAQHSNPANNPSAQHSNPANNPAAQHSNPANNPSAKHSNPANSSNGHTNFFSDENYANALAQYRKGVKTPPRSVLEKLSPSKESVIFRHGRSMPKNKISSLKIDYQVTLHADALLIAVTVAQKQGQAVNGCSFVATEMFTVGGEARKTLCNARDNFNGTYSILCVNPGFSDCVTVTVTMWFCDYEAFKFVKLYNHTLLHDRFCFPRSHVPRPTSRVESTATVVSWSVNKQGKCEKLYFDNVMQTPLTDAEVCACVEGYDRVYFLGTSHIAQFMDFMMVTCEGLDMTGMQHGLKHGDLHRGNLYFEPGRYPKDIYKKLQRDLDIWLHNTSRVAICIQTGQWDLFTIGVYYALEVTLDYYENVIVYVKSRLAGSPSKVDFHILSSPPRPDGHNVDRVAISVFNRKLQLIAERHGVSYINGFAVLDPCANDIPWPRKNHHHYLEGRGNTFDGTAGFAFYKGLFLRALCPHL